MGLRFGQMQQSKLLDPLASSLPHGLVESIDDDASAAFCKILTGEDITPEMIRNGEYKKILNKSHHMLL